MIIRFGGLTAENSTWISALINQHPPSTPNGRIYRAPDRHPQNSRTDVWREAQRRQGQNIVGCTA